MDGVGGTIKNIVFRDVKSGKCLINTPKDFAMYADQKITAITTIYLPQEEVFEEPDEIKFAPKIPETLQVHKIIRRISKEKIPYLEFYKLASDQEPFFTQYYRKDGDPVVCGHGDNDSDENHCGLCGKEHLGISEWLKCPVCQMWFHENCFYA